MPKKCKCSQLWLIDFVMDNKKYFLLSKRDEVLGCPHCNGSSKDEIKRVTELESQYWKEKHYDKKRGCDSVSIHKIFNW